MAVNPPNIQPYGLEQLVTGNALNDNLGEAVRSGGEKINRNLKTLSRVLTRVEGIVNAVAGDTAQILLDIANAKARLSALESRTTANENNIASLAAQIAGITTNVAALLAQIALKANIANPLFTGSAGMTVGSEPPANSNDNTFATTSWVRGQLAGVGSEFATATKILFQQFNAPIGWTRDLGFHDHAIRICGTATAGDFQSSSVGSGFTEALKADVVVGITGATSGNGGNGRTLNHVLTVADMPSHAHRLGYGHSGRDSLRYVGIEDNADFRGYASGPGDSADGGGSEPRNMENTGGGQGHSHEMPVHNHAIDHSHSLNLNIKYASVIVGIKD